MIEGDDRPRPVRGQGRVVARERGDRPFGAVLGRGQQALGAFVVVLDVFSIRVLHG